MKRASIIVVAFAGGCGLILLVKMWLGAPSASLTPNEKRAEFTTPFGSVSSNHCLLTNWLLTPWVPGNEGSTPWEAREGIRQVGTNGLPLLLNLLSCADTNFASPQAQGMAMVGFQALGPLAAPAVKPLIELLHDQRPKVRSGAAVCLAYLRASASQAVPDLVAALRDASPEVRTCAAAALADVPGRPELVVPALVEFLGDPPTGGDDDYARVVAIAALERNYVADAQRAIPILRRLTNGVSPVVGLRAGGLLAMIEGPAEPVLQPETVHDEQVRKLNQR